MSVVTAVRLMSKSKRVGVMTSLSTVAYTSSNTQANDADVEDNTGSWSAGYSTPCHVITRQSPDTIATQQRETAAAADRVVNDETTAAAAAGADVMSIWSDDVKTMYVTDESLQQSCDVKVSASCNTAHRYTVEHPLPPQEGELRGAY